ncbi:WxL domain-containing protein [Enterococcus hirae]|nr:WxL domain-containing protein [Enterococcus hirae]
MKKKITVATLCLMGAGLCLAYAGKAHAASVSDQETDTQITLQGATLPPTPGGSGDGPGGGDTPPISPDTQFGFLFKPHSFDFGNVASFQLGQPLKQKASAGGSVGIGDTRDQAPGWALSVKASPLTMTKDGVTTTLTGTISMTPTVKYVTYNENGDSKYTLGDVPEAQSKVAPTAPSSVALTTGGASQPVMNAKAGQGSNMWAAELSNVSLSATGNQTGNLSAGTYSGTLTWSLSDTPQQ